MQQPSLVESAKRDPEAFGRLFDRYFDLIYRFFWYRCKDRMLSEDLTSETFFKALRQLPHFEGGDEDFLPWLYTIARNTLVDRMRKKQEEPVEIVENDLRTENPYHQVELRMDVWMLLSQLSEQQRQVVQLRFIDDMPVKEIADMIGKSESATKSILYRALKQLKEAGAEGGLGS
jgi:RNA polymerase sigma-70 factor (ECF subfamily)